MRENQCWVQRFVADRIKQVWFVCAIRGLATAHAALLTLSWCAWFQFPRRKKLIGRLPWHSQLPGSPPKKLRHPILTATPHLSDPSISSSNAPLFPPLTFFQSPRTRRSDPSTPSRRAIVAAYRLRIALGAFQDGRARPSVRTRILPPSVSAGLAIHSLILITDFVAIARHDCRFVLLPHIVHLSPDKSFNIPHRQSCRIVLSQWVLKTRLGLRATRPERPAARSFPPSILRSRRPSRQRSRSTRPFTSCEYNPWWQTMPDRINVSDTCEKRLDRPQFLRHFVQQMDSRYPQLQ